MLVQSLQKQQKANSQPYKNSKLVTKYVQIQIVHKLTSSTNTNTNRAQTDIKTKQKYKKK